MSDIIIKSENLCKKYTIGHQAGNESYMTFRDVMMRNARGFWNKTRDLIQGKPIIQGNELEEIWALKDVSFEIKQGESVGIIGRNGAGKSTLLKVLSRITEPSTGRVTIKGRVASLLEVGTGFHPELTGRENIYLNGAILGMTRQEITRKFSEIVEFSEIEKFLDTPVKRFSSGMYVRLAFAVAAYLEPEILLVDEVLAVGDTGFQKKCIRKMGDVANEGRTIIFVSHSMPAIENLCKRVIWIDRGQIVKDGSPKKVVANYIDSINEMILERKVGIYQNLGHRRGTGEIQFTNFRLSNDSGIIKKGFFIGETICMEVDFEAYADINDVVFSINLFDASNQVVITNWVGLHKTISVSRGDKGTFRVTMPNNPFRARNYYFYLGMTNLKNHEIPYDIWDGVGTEFTVSYPKDISNLDFHIGRDLALISIPLEASIYKRDIQY